MSERLVEAMARAAEPWVWRELSEHELMSNDYAVTEQLKAQKRSLEKQRAALAAQEAEGWVLVPDAAHMTDEQAEACAKAIGVCGGMAYDAYRAMLAARPRP